MLNERFDIYLTWHCEFKLTQGPSYSKMAYVFRQGDLPKLDLQVDRGSDFKAWKTQWKAYLSLSGLAEQDQAKQVQALTLCFS